MNDRLWNAGWRIEYSALKDGNFLTIRQYGEVIAEIAVFDDALDGIPSIIIKKFTDPAITVTEVDARE